MTATNHFITGALVATSIQKPILALPLAFLSHFALDALPHFGDSNYRNKLKFFYRVWAIDFIVLMAILIWTLFNAPIWISFAGFIATSPDLVWVYRFYVMERLGKKQKTIKNWFNNFHAKIQKYERHWGLYVELIYFVVTAVILIRYWSAQ